MNNVSCFYAYGQELALLLWKLTDKNRQKVMKASQLKIPPE